ncbi:hypothetical protein KAX02_06380 [candidate division WOR-3 bacterium]|nr:hypothetical protein [candidate division WOR-3 bacterium]
MEIDVTLIREYLKEHKLSWEDEWKRAGVVSEKAKELREAVLQYKGYQTMEEACDVIIAIMVLAELQGWLGELPDLVVKRMKQNIEKPIGDKVRKA